MVIDSGQSMLKRMELHLNTPFCYDAEGRMRTVNEPEQPPAPRFYMVRTQEGNYWRFRYDLPAETIEQLNQLCQAEPHSTDLTVASRVAACLHRRWLRRLPVAQIRPRLPNSDPGQAPPVAALPRSA
jgi:hypothetical protein